MTTTTTTTTTTHYREQHSRGEHKVLWIFPGGGDADGPRVGVNGPHIGFYQRLDAVKDSAISTRLARAVAEHNRQQPRESFSDRLQVIHGINQIGIQCRKVGLCSLAKALLQHAVEGADPVSFAETLVAAQVRAYAHTKAEAKADQLIATVRNARDALTALGAKHAEESLALEIEQIERRLAALTATFAAVAAEAAAAALGCDDAFDDVGEDASLVAEFTRASVAKTPLTFRSPLARPLFMPASSSADCTDMRAALVERLIKAGE